ncbi:type II toxin-antitoxin system HipA family toxin [Oxalobacteraceae bacterium CAVE-383]|nr:type II toxin-antitoxin system HipA family toxin [Oxalobacteraceae bacterium CAVE-383]
MAERQLDVFINEQRVGKLREANDLWAFDYDPAWAASEHAFDLSPPFPRTQLSHVDGASLRPVQWYFDNLLPEEALRTVLAKEADIREDDSFGLLAYFGAESAGSLILISPEDHAPAQTGLRPLPDAALSERIRNLPRLSLTHDAPKHMSLAGAQHKLAIVYRNGQLFEPLIGEPSTHILKPNSQDDRYPATVINEYFVMRLAKALGLPAPNVHRHYTPQPVYIVDRFDRTIKDGRVLRLHMIDACQLLNKSRGFKYNAATLGTLSDLIEKCRVRSAARLWLFQWLVFNLLVGNGDNHLKNISFMVSEEGIEISPVYDLLSTEVYWTKAIANERERWPTVELALQLPGARYFGDVSRQAVIDAGLALGLSQDTTIRELDRMVSRIVPAADALYASIEKENAAFPDHLKSTFAQELHVLRAIRFIVIHDMVGKLQSAAASA